MFERFSDPARRAVLRAQEESRLLEHRHIGTEHLLLALLHDDGVAGQALAAQGVDLDRARAEVEKQVGRGDGPSPGHIAFTPRSKKVLELSLREALQVGHSDIGAEHVLLGLLREGEGMGAKVLVVLGASLDDLRKDVARRLAESPGQGRFGGQAPTETGATATLRSVAATSLVARAFRELSGEATDRGHDRMGTEHILLWLLAQPDSGAVRALENAGIDVDALRSQLERRLEEAGGSTDP